jgi:hypothetical protein
LGSRSGRRGSRLPAGARVHLLCSPHNPTAACTRARRWSRLASWRTRTSVGDLGRGTCAARPVGQHACAVRGGLEAAAARAIVLSLRFQDLEPRGLKAACAGRARARRHGSRARRLPAGPAVSRRALRRDSPPARHFARGKPTVASSWLCSKSAIGGCSANCCANSCLRCAICRPRPATSLAPISGR